MRSSLDCSRLKPGRTREFERGDPVEQVLGDVMGPEGSPAAFLLVAVDILISHWPKTIAVAVPFLGSPELLSLDRDRQTQDLMPALDLGGWGAISPKEPMGPILSADLKKRLSRRWALEALLVPFASEECAERSALHALLVEAAARLGPPEPEDTFADARFMVRHALNLIDRANWVPIEVGCAYVAPSEEAQHLARLQNRQAPQTLDFSIYSRSRSRWRTPGVQVPSWPNRPPLMPNVSRPWPIRRRKSGIHGSTQSFRLR